MLTVNIPADEKELNDTNDDLVVSLSLESTLLTADRAQSVSFPLQQPEGYSYAHVDAFVAMMVEALHGWEEATEARTDKLLAARTTIAQLQRDLALANTDLTSVTDRLKPTAGQSPQEALDSTLTRLIADRTTLAQERDQALQERNTFALERDQALQERNTFAQERDQALQERNTFAQERRTG